MMTLVANTHDKILLKYLSETEGKKNIHDLLKEFDEKQRKSGHEVFPIFFDGERYHSPVLWKTVAYLADNFLIDFEKENGNPTISINELGRQISDLYQLPSQTERMLKTSRSDFYAK